MPTKTVDVSIDGAAKTVEVPAPRKKTCELKNVLPASVIPLIAANPKNDTIRNLMLAHLKQPVPVECDTFEKVKEWIEYNIVHEQPESLLDKQMRLQEEQRQIRERNAVQVMVAVSGTEAGRCDYSCEVEGQNNIAIQRSDIVSAASEADSSDDFFSRMVEIIDDMGVENYVSYEGVRGTYNYCDYESDMDETHVNTELPIEGKDALKAALRAADPELYRSLFGE